MIKPRPGSLYGDCSAAASRRIDDGIVVFGEVGLGAKSGPFNQPIDGCQRQKSLVSSKPSLQKEQLKYIY